MAHTQTSLLTIQQLLKTFAFKKLFIEVLGWDNPRQKHAFSLAIDGQDFTIEPVAEKRGFAIYICRSTAVATLPDAVTMRKIDREIEKIAYEHVLIYIDSPQENQDWLWVRRAQGKPLAARHEKVAKGQSGEMLAQKLERLSFDLDQEASLTLHDVTQSVKSAFDTERVTKKFYERFRKEHSAFLALLAGIQNPESSTWYASLMLNRLMFIYFIQKKGFLDRDTNYLSNRLQKVQESCGPGEFHSFYRSFLLKLFHEGLSQREHSRELEALLGNVPYLNGGLFDVHAIEQENPDIQIPDAAFEHVFAFFDEFNWHLDDRPLSSGNEINPDVLGFIFEKYINQKQMGAYYTREDITGYIGRNTILPYILDQTKEHCLIAFTEESSPVWDILRRNPDRYIYPAVQHGCDLHLPAAIEAGVHDVAQRTEWNIPAPSEYALPTEIWREVVARRTRCKDVKAKLAAGEVTSSNDLITYNLDIELFVKDCIGTCEDASLLTAFYTSLTSVTILDPTCGSGAFLFAALNILEPLYESCLDRMQALLEERTRLDAELPASQRHASPPLENFRQILADVTEHPNRKYFVFKSIIVQNLYGVDIMEEATEICKLRLFLKLVSQIDRVADIEPLPDIDFNIRAGNTLIGYATLAEVEKASEDNRQRELFSTYPITLGDIIQKAEEVDRDFRVFQQTQTLLTHLETGTKETHKQLLQRELQDLRDILDRYLASQYGIDSSNIVGGAEAYHEKFAEWKRTHQPFHWFAEFYGIMKDGGFDVIIGNPPYVEYSKVKSNYTINGYKTESCGNLYAFTMERASIILKMMGRNGMIVPLSGFTTQRMTPLQETIKTRCTNVHINFLSGDAHPAMLFDGVKFRLCIALLQAGNTKCTFFSTKYTRWYGEERNRLFEKIDYQESTDTIITSSFSKMNNNIGINILNKIQKQPALGTFLKKGQNILYYHNCPVNWIRATTFIPKFQSDREGEGISSQIKPLSLESVSLRDTTVCVINSTLFFWFWLIYSDCYHLTEREYSGFPVQLTTLSQKYGEHLTRLCSALNNDYKKNALERVYIYKTTGKVVYDEFYPKKSKHIIDEIDRVLAQHYGFTDEELDFIINYDIKYRMGRTAESADDAEEVEG